MNKLQLSILYPRGIGSTEIFLDRIDMIVHDEEPYFNKEGADNRQRNP